jgi:hypothetical protein
MDCLRLYSTLLWMTDQPITIAPYYVREFQLTENCDHIRDLTKQREELKANIGHYAYERLMSHYDNYYALDRVTQAYIHFRYEHRALLLQ